MTVKKTKIFKNENYNTNNNNDACQPALCKSAGYEGHGYE